MGEQTSANDMVVLVSGTGSIAIRYRRQGSHFVQVARAGGWGPLLGDDGSGFDIGRQAIRHALGRIEDARYKQNDRSLKPADLLTTALVDHYRPSDGTVDSDYDLLSSVLLGDSNEDQSPSQAKRRIASCAQLVVHMAQTNAQAAAISSAAQQKLVDMVQTLLNRSGDDHSEAVLVVAGGVMQSERFRDSLASCMVSNGMGFKEIMVPGQLTLEGARYLAKVVG